MVHGLCQDLREHSRSADKISYFRGEVLVLCEQDTLLVMSKLLGYP